MAVKLLAVFACLLALTQVDGIQVNSDGKIKLSVYTTSGCGDTVRFITNHVAEAYSLYGNFLDIEFIPWGKSQWDGVGPIVCQFGAADCWANRLHRCALKLLEGNQAAQVHYMTCEFASPYPSFLLGNYQCAQAVGLNLIEVDYCVANNHDDLDRAAQAASTEPIGAFDFVPAIVFNDVINGDDQEEAQSRLASMICFALADDPNSGVTSCSI